MFEALAVLDGPIEMAGAGATVAEALLGQSETGLIALDGDLRVVLVNRAARALLGLERCRTGDPLGRVIEQAAALVPGATAALRSWLGSEAGPDTLLQRADGRALSVRRASGPECHLLLAITMESGAAAPSARRDSLTGLPDRTWFHDHVAAMLEAALAPAVMMIDLDRFKAVNDTLGHWAGDAVLQLVAKRLRTALRDGDMICRIAGDEFAVAMRRPADPDGVARRLVGVLSRPYLIEGATTSIGASIGVALAPEHGRDPKALMRAADVALYAAKDGGRGATRVFDRDLERSARERHGMIEALGRAVPQNHLELHYQPQVSIETGRVTGFEALVRWNHPEFGLLPPDRFIPIAEESGLIWTIGDWVLRTACEEATTWPSDLSVSVNISSKQLLDRNRLARTVKRVLLKSGLAPHRLELEITETALIREAETLPVMLAIRETGVRISLDDFGTGCSSLSQLRRFPLDKLKIDRSFIAALGSSQEASNLVRAIASLGRSLGISTIAEGVETEDQQRRLMVEGCQEMQGFLLSRPVRASEVRPLVAALDSFAASA